MAKFQVLVHTKAYGNNVVGDMYKDIREGCSIRDIDVGLTASMDPVYRHNTAGGGIVYIPFHNIDHIYISEVEDG